jgi:hypothetical protein
MKHIDEKDLLKDRRVVEEINRHLWIESEKEGHNITFEKAANEWFDKFAKAWTEHYLPNARFIKNGKKDKNI